MDTDQIAEIINAYSEQFDRLCLERHEAGKAEYGVFTFLGNDVTRMMAEELADTANYCRMQFIKLMMLNDLLSEELKDKADDTGAITLGVKAFKGAGEVGWDK